MNVPHSTALAWHSTCASVPFLDPFTGGASFFLSSSMCSCAILAYSMAEMSTSQVGGCLWGSPWPSLHLTSPACTTSSTLQWSLKHASIVGVSRPTPSRTALALPAAFLLTCSLKSMMWSGRSVGTARPLNPWTFLADGEDDHKHSPITSWHNASSPSLGTGGLGDGWGVRGVSWDTGGLSPITQILCSTSFTSCSGHKGKCSSAQDK